jgi:hypothetical protein
VHIQVPPSLYAVLHHTLCAGAPFDSEPHVIMSSTWCHLARCHLRALLKELQVHEVGHHHHHWQLYCR